MPRLIDLIRSRQDWLLQCSLEYVRKRRAVIEDELWREFVTGLTSAFAVAVDDDFTLPNGCPADDPARDPVASLGIPLGRSCRQPGLSLSLLLGVVNAYRDACADLIAGDGGLSETERENSAVRLERFLDRIESGICAGWTGGMRGGIPSDELLRAVLDAVPDILLVKDRNCVFLGVSEQYTDLMGRGEETIIGGTDFDIFPRPDAIRYKAEEVSVMESGESIVAEHLLDTSLGERWFEAIKSPLRNRRGEVLGVLSTERDVTERKRLEAEASEQRRFLQTILDTLTDAVLFKDLDSRIVLCNHAVKEFFRKSETEIVGKTEFDLLPEAVAQQCRAEDREVIETGRTIRSQHRTDLPDGARWNETIRTPLRDERGGVVGVLATMRDITEQVRARTALQESEAYVKTILESMPVGTLVIDAETHTIVDVNSAALGILGRSREEIVGDPCLKHICPDANGRCPISDLGQVTDYAQHAVIRADGTTVPVLKTVTQIALQGKPVLLESIVDITEQLEAQESLRESEERYRGLVELSPISILVHSEGRLVFANPEAVRTLGVSSVADLIGRPMMDFIHPEQWEFVAARVDRIYRGEALPGLVEEKFVRADGTPLDVEVIATPITFEGKPASQSVFRDITARKQAENALEAERTLFQALMDNLPDSIYFKDTQLRFVRVNRSQADLLGCGVPEDAVGKTDFDFFTPEHASKSSVDERRILDTGAPMVGNLERTTRADGRSTWMSTTEVPLYGSDGELIGLVGLSRDVDEQVRAEAERDDQRRMLRAVLDTLPDVVIFKDRHSAYQLCNEQVCDFYGKTMAELLGKTDFDLWPLDEASRFREEELEAMDSGRAVVNERLTSGPHGERWEEAIKVPLRDDTGEVIGVLSVGRDITERREAEAERDAQRRMLQAVMNTTPDTFTFVDREGVYLFCDEMFAGLLELGVDEVIGKSIADLWPRSVAEEIREEELGVEEILDHGAPPEERGEDVDAFDHLALAVAR